MISIDRVFIGRISKVDVIKTSNEKKRKILNGSMISYSFDSIIHTFNIFYFEVEALTSPLEAVPDYKNFKDLAYLNTLILIERLIMKTHIMNTLCYKI